MLQVDEAVTSSEVNPADVNPMEQIAGVIGKVAQFLGKMEIRVEGVGDVEDDPLVALLGSDRRSSWHDGHPVLG